MEKKIFKITVTANFQANRIDKFLKISSGGSEIIIEKNMSIVETEPSINLEELISKYIFESGK